MPVVRPPGEPGHGDARQADGGADGGAEQGGENRKRDDVARPDEEHAPVRVAIHQHRPKQSLKRVAEADAE